MRRRENVKINITIPKKLNTEVRKMREKYVINISRVCTRAIEAEVARLQKEG